MIINILAAILGITSYFIELEDNDIKILSNKWVKRIILPVFAFFIWKYVFTGIYASIMGIIHIIIKLGGLL